MDDTFQVAQPEDSKPAPYVHSPPEHISTASLELNASKRMSLMPSLSF